MNFTKHSCQHSSFLVGPVSPSLEYCSDQNSSQCDVPVPDVNPLILCAPTDALHRVCKPYSPQGISTLKYNVKDSSAYFQVRWSRPAVPCPGYTWRARMCQSDALVSQAGFTQTTTTENHTNTFQCTAPWNDNFEPNREYWKFNRLEQNTHYILQVERITENTSECTVFTSPSMFVGGYGELVNKSGPIAQSICILCTLCLEKWLCRSFMPFTREQ